MNVDAADVVDVVVVEEQVKEAAEAEAKYEVTILIHYLVHIIMELLFLKLRYMIKVNIKYFPEINKLKFKNSKVRLVGSMDIPRLIDMFQMTKDTQLYQLVWFMRYSVILVKQ